MSTLNDALKAADWTRARGATMAVLTLYDQGALVSPRLAIAHEIDGSLLDIAQARSKVPSELQMAAQKQTHLAIATFLAGAALEDALRRGTKQITVDFLI